MVAGAFSTFWFYHKKFFKNNEETSRVVSFSVPAYFLIPYVQ